MFFHGVALRWKYVTLFEFGKLWSKREQRVQFQVELFLGYLHSSTTYIQGLHRRWISWVKKIKNKKASQLENFSLLSRFPNAKIIFQFTSIASQRLCFFIARAQQTFHGNCLNNFPLLGNAFAVDSSRASVWLWTWIGVDKHFQTPSNWKQKKEKYFNFFIFFHHLDQRKNSNCMQIVQEIYVCQWNSVLFLLIAQHNVTAWQKLLTKKRRKNFWI